MTQSEKDAIVKKCVELGFEEVYKGFNYDLPLGYKNNLYFCTDDLELGIIQETRGYVTIRKIDSPEDLETLFNAICPEKYRLPFR